MVLQNHRSENKTMRPRLRPEHVASSFGKINDIALKLKNKRSNARWIV